MANTVDSNTATGSVEPVDASASTLLTRAGWGLFTVAYLAFAVLTVATVQTGTHGDPRTTNPTPGPVPYPPFLGFDNWPLVVAFSSIPMALGLIGSLVWLSVRQRRLHWAVVIAFAGLITGALDPLANWATFAMFDPRMLHFPRSWPYMNISPNLEPALSFLGGYAAYYLLNGLGILQLHDRFLDPMVRRTSWLARHRLAAVFFGAFVIAIPLNGFVQFSWLRFGIFYYSEAVGPTLRIGHIHFPLIMAVYDSFIFAMVAVMCVRDQGGELVLINRIARRLPARSARNKVTLTRQLLVSASVGLVSFGVPLAVLSGLRVAGLSAPAYEQNPYPNVKVYDPYGHLEESGKPGPFYT
ncbi:spirocyclase AveC family protein [Mycobacterium intracellulare]|uniref:spirocyclase AveC family protein n=1 Tax=Mycobacterium intracellulare TaxID=1767 RepID=UPI001E6379D4|nr:spirocyclase AveC family protein [Mycobacterium intracellulare]UGU03147.1 spirocyclase AveC family protein [Mycobacterium intracellulare]